MKFQIFLLILFITINLESYGQNKKHVKTWISNDLDYLRIDDKYVYFELYGLDLHQHPYVVKDNMLNFFRTYSSSRDNFKKQHTDTFTFKIEKLTANELILVPQNVYAKEISGGKLELNYIDKKSIKNSLKFSRISYHILGGAWQWVDLAFSIDSDSIFKYANKSVKGKPEYFEGKLSVDQYDQLITLLKSSKIDKWRSFNQIIYDSPESTLEIDYNGKTKSLKQDMLPAITLDLTNFIRELQKKIPLVKTEPFDIKFQN